jgi:hypothetical protein
LTLDDTSGSLLELLRPKIAIARLAERAEPRSADDLAQVLEAGAILRVLEAPPAARPDAQALRTAAHLDQELRRSLPAAGYAAWRGHLASIAASTQPLSGALLESRTALLTPVAGGTSDASLAWFLGAAVALPRLQLGALIAGGARRRRARIRVDADVDCELCDAPQYAAGNELAALGARGLAALNVAPICRACLGAAARDPELWEQRRSGRARAALRIIAGANARSDSGKSRAALHIVRGS